MARLPQTQSGSVMTASSSDPLADLNRLLNRLQQTVLRADAERQRRLMSIEFERSKVNKNIEHARTLLTRLEQGALNIKVHTRRQELQADLNRNQLVLEELVDKMKDLEDMTATFEEEEDGTSSEDELILGDDGNVDHAGNAVGSNSLGETSLASPDEHCEHNGGGEPGPSPIQPGEAESSNTVPALGIANPLTAVPDTAMVSQTIRSRVREPQPEKEVVRVTGRSGGAGDGVSGGGGGLMSPRNHTATTEAVLDQQRAEQVQLSDAILKMASGLKQSSQAFANSLEEDKSVLGRAGEGLNKNELGLEAAARRMGTLTKITESKNWWGRIILYAWIYGLMVVLILFVFAMPKLRF